MCGSSGTRVSGDMGGPRGSQEEEEAPGGGDDLGEGRFTAWDPMESRADIKTA